VVHGSDAHPFLEVQAFHEPQRAAGILPAENAWLCRRDVGSTFLGRTARVAKVHGPDARPFLEVVALHEPQRAAGILPAEGASLPTRRRQHVAARKVSLCVVHGPNAQSQNRGGFP